MLEVEHIKELLDKHGFESIDYESPIQNSFIEGLTLLHQRSTVKHGSKYGADHEVFYADRLSDLEGLTEDDVIQLARCGFHLSEDETYFQRFV